MNMSAAIDNSKTATANRSYQRGFSWRKGGVTAMTATLGSGLPQNEIEQLKPDVFREKKAIVEADATSDFEAIVEGYIIASRSSGSGENRYFFNTPVSKQSPWIEEALSAVRDFKSLENDWDGFGSLAPPEDTINDVIVVLQNWPKDLPPSEPSVLDDGNVVLEMYDGEDFAIGGIEFIGNHVAVYTAINRTQKILASRFDSEEPNEMRIALEALKEALA
jgi:hypothetical protein